MVTKVFVKSQKLQLENQRLQQEQFQKIYLSNKNSSKKIYLHIIERCDTEEGN